MQNVAVHIEKLIGEIEMNKPDREKAKRYSDVLGRLTNELKGFAQRLAEEMQAKNGDSGIDAETQAKVQSMLITAQAKARNTKESHAQRTAQREAQFQLEQQRKDQEHALEMRRELESQQVEDTATDIKTAAEIRRDRAKAAAEPKETAE